MTTAVQFGAGNIGRGFIGQLLYDAGCQTVFIEAQEALADALTARGAYPLRLVSDTHSETRVIGHVRALLPSQQKDVVDALAQADLVGTSVGAGVLPRIAPLLAAGINARAAAGAGPVNILLCENQWHCAGLMRELLTPHIAPGAQRYFAERVGLVEAVIGRMVPAPTEALRAEDPLLVVAEPYQELPVAKTSLRAPLPPLPGLIEADPFEAYEARKLFLHNMGHAALAYGGSLRGHAFIWQCAEDPPLAALCREALGEVAGALSSAYGAVPGFSPAALDAFAQDLLRRFTNKALGDPVARVAADPLRKLRPDDRLIGAARLCEAQGVETKALATVIAAALLYDAPDDPAAQQLQQRRREQGDAGVLHSLCGVAPDAPLSASVLHALDALPRAR